MSDLNSHTASIISQPRKEQPICTFHNMCASWAGLKPASSLTAFPHHLSCCPFNDTTCVNSRGSAGVCVCVCVHVYRHVLITCRSHLAWQRERRPTRPDIVFFLSVAAWQPRSCRSMPSKGVISRDLRGLAGENQPEYKKTSLQLKFVDLADLIQEFKI